MNSVMQCLIHVEEFCSYFLNFDFEKQGKFEITMQLKKLLYKIQENNISRKNPLNLKDFHELLFKNTKNSMVIKKKL